MQSHRDSSLLRNLAVAFGDGVAFGVGMKLTQNPAKKAGPSMPRDLAPLEGRLAEMEKRMERIEQTTPMLPVAATMTFDQHALNALVTSFEARLEEHAGHAERLIAELELRLSLEIKSTRQQDQSLTSSMTALHDQMIALHREFAEAVGAIVEEQVAAQVEAGVEKLQQAVAAAVEEKVGALREQIEAKSTEISTLQERLQESDRNVLEVILGMGELCRQVGERLKQHPVPKEPPADSDSPSDISPSGGVPGFAQHSGRSVLQIPLLSSLALTGVGLYLLYFL
jgi:DNA repair exonuclease SbcCD ATPase subunit